MTADTDPLTFTDDEIDTLNAARLILFRKHTRHFTGPGSVRVATVAEVADDAIFRVLSWTNAYIGQPLTADQLHHDARPPRTVEPQSLRA